MVNQEIYKGIPSIDMGDQLRLSGMYPNILKFEQEMYFRNSSSLELKKYIPGAYVSNLAEAELKVMDYFTRFVTRQGILFCIRIKESNTPVGYILINAPNPNHCGNKWNIDFWIYPKAENRGIMSLSLPYILNYLVEMNIDIVHAQVRNDNFVAIHILDSLGFSDISNSFKQLLPEYMLFGVRLI